MMYAAVILTTSLYHATYQETPEEKFVTTTSLPPTAWLSQNLGVAPHPAAPGWGGINKRNALSGVEISITWRFPHTLLLFMEELPCRIQH